ncbi:MAG: helix-turn-helix transcriptional regulator [Acaryochloris sp. RU_4_1]|nr:helix-turn-helix transcriptional regulator [Acaryochloris sp. RU_4_1]NJR56016.1 helix-turn-helix transcriptional regulator [Acaryochloris sp. CRU_2_0]
MSMEPVLAPDYTPQLKQLMHMVGLHSFAALARVTGVSQADINRLRRGRILELRLEKVLQLTQALEVPLEGLVTTFSSIPPVAVLKPSQQERADLKFPTPTQTKSQPAAQEYSQLQQTLDTLNQEYQRLQKQLQDQQAQLWQEYQRSTVQALESLLLQWPTAAYAARQHPEAPAVKILPLLHPLEALLDAWGMVPIGEVGAEIAFDPQWHQLMPGGGSTATKGDKVTVRYVGYRQGETLLYRAKVSPL